VAHEVKDSPKSSGRFEEREQLNAAMMSASVTELTSVSESEEPLVTTAALSPLLAALHAVGRVQGIAIRDTALDLQGRDPLRAIADASGVRIRKVRLQGRWWERDSSPLLGFMADSGTPIALLPARSRFSRSRFDVLHVATNERQPIDASFAAKLAHSAYVLYREFPDRPRVWDLFQFGLSGMGGDIALVVICGVVASILGMLAPQATAVIVDYAIPDANRNLLLTVALGLVAAGLGILLFDFAQAASFLRLETTAAGAIQTGLWDRLLKLRPAFFRRFTVGDLESRANAIHAIRQRVSGVTLAVLFSAFASMLNAALMLYYSPWLGIVAIVLSLIIGTVIVMSAALAMRLMPGLQELEGRLAGLVVQLTEAVPKLRIAGAEQRAFAYWAETYSRKQRIQHSVTRLQDRIRLFSGVTPVLGSAAIFSAASQVMSRDNAGLTLGTFLAFNAAFAAFLSGLTSFSETGISLLGVTSLWNRARTIIDAEPELDHATVHQSLRLAGGVKMDRVTFRYRSDGPHTLENVTLEAKPGECIALVGPSGSGKSTILSLLLGFEKPASGAVYFDDHDLKGLNVADVRRQIGVVMQDNKIMAGSLFDNIACGSLCTLDDAWEAARAASLSEDIEQMPMGLHTMLSEGGGNLSGGQRQRVLIARALILKPTILILDEATSALDNRTQAVVTRNLAGLKVTRILVAHRLSTIRNADRIYVIDQGRVAQVGTFDSLSKDSEMFGRLMSRQMA
jgi:NHLM bacteriocin system ABC transporter ATP-binding protein